MAYNRYMRGMSNGGMVSSFDNATPLSNDEIRAAVPSIFATEAHESRSDRFIPVPTVHVMDALRSEGFRPVFAQQAKTRVPGKAEFTRHMLRMRHASMSDMGGRAFEVILTNANDGTSAYKMIAGIFRFVCLNGLFTGDTFTPVHVRHNGADVIENVKAGAMNILRIAPEALALTDEMKGTRVSFDEAESYARAAHLVRFPRAYDETESGPVLVPSRVPVEPVDLLRSRRTEDRHATAWHLFNIVQENAIKGGQRGLIVGTKGQTRHSTVRAVTGIADSEKVNGALWDMAVAFTKFKRAT